MRKGMVKVLKGWDDPGFETRFTEGLVAVVDC